MTAPHSRTAASDTLAIVDKPDHALADRLEAEIAAFNFDATGIRDARDFVAALYDIRDAACPQR